MTVNFVDLPEQYVNIDLDSVMTSISGAISSASFVGGSALDTFEANFSTYCDVSNTVGVGSGTDALILALKALGIGTGDEVIVPNNTFIATALAVTHVGATPVFVDVDPSTYLLTAEAVESGITDNTKAIIPVHLYGNAVDMPSIMSIADNKGYYVIEDCAQAIGAMYNGRPVGTFGNAGCYSFYPAKNLGGLGQGGAVITNDDDLAATVRSLGNVGRKEGSWYEYDKVGYNSRLDSINAIFLTENLTHVEDWNNMRRAHAASYKTKLRNCTKVYVPAIDRDVNPVYHLFELRVRDKDTRDSLKEYLLDKDIKVALHYPVPCSEQEVYADLTSTASLDNSLALADTLLSLPMHPYLTESEITEVCDAIIAFFK